MKQEMANILIVDDNELNCDMLSRRLQRFDYTIDIADNGYKAISIIEKKKIDLILLDIIMPEISGIEVLKKIREKYSVTSLPIIMVTAKDDSEGIVECLEYGANDYITKPINFPIVLARIKTQVLLRKAGEEQENLVKSLHKLNSDKDKFFSILSHDLKTPLTPIIAAADVIIDNIDTISYENIRIYAEMIGNAVENLSGLLESLLQWSGIQIGRIKYDPQKIDINELFNENIEILSMNADKKNISLIEHYSDNFEVYADRNMICTIIRNLLSNAIKFTQPGGKVELKAKKNDGFIEISISDSGVGLSKEAIDKLFRIDTIYSTVGTGKEKGSGLGLILCKEFIEKNNGKIWVESEIGKGTSFTFSLPQEPINIET